MGGGGASQTPPFLFSPHLNHWGGGDESALESAVADLLRGLPIITSAGEDGQRTTDHLPTRPPTFAKGGAGGSTHHLPFRGMWEGVSTIHCALMVPPSQFKPADSRGIAETSLRGAAGGRNHVNLISIIVGL